MKKSSLPLLLLGCALALAGTGCPNPASPNRTVYTIRGRIHDSVTGAGIPGTTISVGTISTRTDAAGEYSFKIDSEELIAGTFGVWKGLDYSFWILPGVSIDPTRNPRYNIPLRPRDDSAYPSTTISGRLPRAAQWPAKLRVWVRNGSGGFDSELLNLPAGTAEYSVEVQTRGAGCLVAFSYQEEDGFELCRYYAEQNLNGPLTLNLDNPGEAPTAVAVNGGSGGFFTADLAVAGYGKILGYVPEKEIPDFGGWLIGVYNPDQHPLVWQRFSTRVAGDLTYHRFSYSTPTPFSPLVNLPPAPAGHRDPQAAVDVGSVVIDEITLSFDAVAGANMYYVLMADDGGTEGIIGMTDSSIDLPPGFFAEVLEAGTGWDADFRSGWTSSEDPTLYIEFGSAGSDNPEGCQMVYVTSPASVVVDFIP